MSTRQGYQYDPFKYPPDMDLARLHSRCSEPGDENPQGEICPCCNVQEKKFVTNWAKRSISEDFKQNGAVLSYFSLMKFYSIAMLISIGVYSCYQMYCLQYICSKFQKEDNQCVNVFGVWIISNMDLAKIMKQDEGKKTILLILRSIVFILLIIANMFSLVIASRTKNIIIDVSSYALFFKNIPPEWKQQELSDAIKQINPEIEIKDILFFRKTSSYARSYNTKINTYFALKDDQLKPKKRVKLEQILIKSTQQAWEKTKNIDIFTPRAVVIFNHLDQRAQVYKKYQIGFVAEILLKIKIIPERMYVTTAPLIEDVIWENIGQQSKGKTKMKVVTFLLMTTILGISYVVLHFGMIMADKDDKKSINIKEKSWSTFISLLVVFMALVFRAFMNKLADMRKSNTKTSRTLFIVSTTVIYHFIYFLIVPTFYFVAADQDRSKKLFSISYQAFNFIIVQLIIAGFDVFYCCWDKGRTKILGIGKKGLCQRQVHNQLTSPRFAIQFKLIIMFKSWSFVTFYGFEVPYLLVFLFLSMVFIFIMDKRHVYIHYRLQLIESKVQYNFLKIYSNFFTIFICVIFLLTQNLTYEIYIALGISILAIVFQILYTTKRPQISIQDNKSLQQYNPTDTYRSKYEQFLLSLKNPRIDKEIDEFTNNMQSQINLSRHNLTDAQQKLLN